MGIVQEAIATITEGDEQFKEELVAAYLQNFERFQKYSIKSIKNRDLNGFHSELHTIKPSMVTLGYGTEYERISDIQKNFQSRLSEEYIVQIQNVARKIISELKSI